MDICQADGCTHEGKYDDKCALHCIKGGYQNDKIKGVLGDFNDLLVQYIFADFKKGKPA